MIKTSHLTKKFPIIKKYREMFLHPLRRSEITALKDVTIEVKKGDVFGLLGPNGSGKTTLIKILCTLVLPTSGEAYVNGMNVTKKGKEVRKTIGYVISDERSFYWRLTGKQNLKFSAKLNNLSRNEAELRIKTLLSTMKLDDYADRMFKDYSTGMRQKLAIARGLLTNPEVIFMDEPTRSLDPRTVQSLKKLIRENLVGEQKKTIVFASHNLHEVEEICDCIAIISKGEVKKIGTVQEIKKNFYAHKYYSIHLEKINNDILEKINNLVFVKEVIPASQGTSPEIHVKITGENDSLSQLIQNIIALGGNISAIYKKDISLEEVFSKIVDS